MTHPTTYRLGKTVWKKEKEWNLYWSVDSAEKLSEYLLLKMGAVADTPPQIEEIKKLKELKIFSWGTCTTKEFGANHDQVVSKVNELIEAVNTLSAQKEGT